MIHEGIYTGITEWGGSGYLVTGAQAPGTQVKALWLTVYSDSSWMNIRSPATIGTSFRMTDIMTEQRCFPA